MSVFDIITNKIRAGIAKPKNTPKKETRRKIQGRNRSANNWGLKPFTPTPSLKEIADVQRLQNHVAQSLDDQYDGTDLVSAVVLDPERILQQERQNEVDFAEMLDQQYTAKFTLRDMPPSNGYDYRRDLLPEGHLNAVKPKGSNAWPWNRALKCCGKNEKTCQCGEWRRYF